MSSGKNISTIDTQKARSKLKVERTLIQQMGGGENMPKLTKEEAVNEVEKCEGRFATICFFGTGASFSGKVVMVRRESNAVELAISPIPFDRWSRTHTVRVPVGDHDIRAAFSEEIGTSIKTPEMIVRLKEMCADDAGCGTP